MPRPIDPRALFCKRLKEARLAAGLSQRQLGIRADIDPFVASTRINRYEKGVHQADLGTASRLAKALELPLAYFFAEDERLARMIATFSKLTRAEQERILREMEKSKA
jgi:transcriptional regulator with XRE-family HTH domain